MNVRTAKHLLLVTLVLGIAPLAVRADRDTPRHARAVASASGKHFMLVVPVDERMTSWIWTTYELGELGRFKEVWSAPGGFARDIYLADDGIHTVCLESWPTKPQKMEDIVIVVFEYGKPIKAIKISEVVRNAEKITQSVGHYSWLDDRTPPFARGFWLYFKTIDGDSHELDMRTGVCRLDVRQ